jgi:hypothetical protein
VSTKMTEEEAALAEEVRAAVNLFSTSSERSEQDKAFIIGPSNIGYCSERLRRQLDRQVPEDPIDWNKAFIGTAIGDYLEQAMKAANPDLVTQVDMTVQLHGDRYHYEIPGHADVLDPVRGLLLDAKAKDGLEYVRRQKEPDRGYQYQRHLYALGAFQNGLFPNHALEDVTVGNIYYDRSGRDPVPHVQLEPFSHEVIRDAVWWLEEVIDTFIAGEEASKEPPREVCQTTCGFFSKCRAYDTDVEGLIKDTRHLEAIDLYLDGQDLKRQGTRMMDQAKARLVGVEGHTPDITLRWTLVNGGERHYVQDDYLKMGITKRKTK